MCVGPYAECSVEEPIANSSMLVLPRMTTPASLRRRVTVASYGGRQPSRIRDPQVVGMPFIAQDVLQSQGYAGKRPELLARRPLGVDGPSSRQRAVGVDVQERVDVGVDRGDAVEVGPGNLLR